MARDVDRKLRATSAVLGTATRKELASAFHKVNPATPFDVDRADKWLQGRAKPRGPQLYDDWANVLGIDVPGAWIADCDIEAFLDVVCERHGIDRETVRQRSAPARRLSAQPEGGLIAGVYVSYSHAWSPYYRGRLIRGALSITAAPKSQRPIAIYTQNLPTGSARLEGGVTMAKDAVHLDLRQSGGHAHVTLCLFPPTLPVSLLAGFMCGTPVIGPEPQPTVTRIVLVRLADPGSRLTEADAYLPPERSLAADLAALGMPVADPTQIDRQLTRFLATGSGNGFDQTPASDYRALVDLLDRSWLETPSAGVA